MAFVSGFSSSFSKLKTKNSSSTCIAKPQQAVSQPRMVIAPPPTPTTPAATPSTPDNFSERISGEWTGTECFFSAINGTCKTIAERYVPDAYRDWGVEIHAFETVTASKVTSDNDNTNNNSTLRLKHLRILPSVGCEADAVSTEEILHEIDMRDAVCFSDSSFVSKDMFCMYHPAGKTRVRIASERYRTISVVIEEWEAVWNDGQVLPGCSGAPVAFGKEAINERNESEWIFQREAGDAIDITDKGAVHKKFDMPRGITVEIDEDDRILTTAWAFHEAQSERVVLERTLDENGKLGGASWRIERLDK